MDDLLKPDNGLDRELGGMLAGVEKRMTEQGARSQALAANSMLALLGQIECSKLSPEKRAQFVREIFGMAAYALAGLPVVQDVVMSARELPSKEAAVRAIVRTLGFLFQVDPEPLVKQMLPEDDAAVGSLSGHVGV
jgi:hypothetical protein